MVERSDCLGFGGNFGVSLGFFPTAPGDCFASKLVFNDFGVVEVEPSLLCAKAEFLLNIMVLVSGVVN